MAAPKPEVPISQPVAMIGTQFQGSTPIFKVQQLNGTMVHCTWNKGVQKFKMVVCKPEVLIFQLVNVIKTQFQGLPPFSKTSNSMAVFAVVLAQCLTSKTWQYKRYFGNFFANMYTSWNIRYFLWTSGWWPPSLSSDISRRRTVFPLVSTCCLTSKTWVYSRCNFFDMMYRSWDKRYVISTSG